MTSTYEAVEGTEPVANGAHEPRTVKRVVTADSRFDPNDDLKMMTEIGDGVFVQWSQCHKCTKQVYDCKCAGGPQEPAYITRWRDARFEKTLNERPEPSYELIPSLITWLQERGYTVAKEDEPAAEEEVGVLGYLASVNEDPDADYEEPINPDPEDEDKLTAQVDAGLDSALEKVREARLDEIEVDF